MSDTTRPESIREAARGGWFGPTHWTVVLAAGRDEGPDALRAREELCRAYWQPVYCYLRRCGRGVHDAEDLTQGFFAHLLEQNAFAKADPARGRFRSFLLTALRHYAADEQGRARSVKRGHGRPLLSLDHDVVEERFLRDPYPNATAEVLFDQRWATGVLEQALARLRADCQRRHRLEEFEQLKRFLAQEGSAAEYAAVGEVLHRTPAAVRMAACRMRDDFRRRVRAELARLVSSPAEVEEELRHLCVVLTHGS